MPCPVVVGAGEVLWDLLPDGEHFGGAPANVAMHAAALGADAWLVSAVGRDARGEAALARLDAAGVGREAVQALAGHPTGVVRVAVDTGGRPSYDIAPGSAWDHIAYTPAVALLAGRADAICFGSLAQRSPDSRATIRHAVAATAETAWRLFDVNLRQSWFDREVVTASLALANAVKLNDEERPVLAELCGLEAATPADQLRTLCDRYGLRLAALTRGPRGALLVTPERSCACAAPPTDVVDTVGAGDAFAATLLVDLLAGRPLDEVGRHANAVASFVCSRPGATPPIPEALRWPA